MTKRPTKPRLMECMIRSGMMLNLIRDYLLKRAPEDQEASLLLTKINIVAEEYEDLFKQSL